MQLRTLTNALARTVCVAANFFNLTSDEVFFTTGPHLITPVHVGGKLVKGFFKNIRKKIKKKPPIKKKCIISRARPRNNTFFFNWGLFFTLFTQKNQKKHPKKSINTQKMHFNANMGSLLRVIHYWGHS